MEKAVRNGLDHSPEFLRERDSLLIARMRADELEPQLRSARVEDVEVEQRCREPRSAFAREPAVRVAVLALEADATDTAKRSSARQSLRAAREKALQLPATEHGFGALAIEFSQHRPSRFAGGDLGWLSTKAPYGDFRACVVKAALQLTDPGSISQVIGDERGLYLVRLTARRETGAADLGRVHANVVQKLLQEKRHALEKAYLNGARQNCSIQVWTSRVSAVELPANSLQPHTSVQLR